MTEVTNQPGPANKRRLTIILGVVGGILAVCLCCGVLAGGVIGLDPFHWHLLDRALGRYDSIADSVPADTVAYGTLDLAALASPDAARIFKAFSEVPGAQDYDSLGDTTKSLDKTLEDALGITFTDDIQPWIGLRAGIAYSDITSTDFGGFDGSFVFLVESRNDTEAQAFLTHLMDAMKDKNGTTFTTSTYEDITIYTQDASFGSTGVLAYSKGLVMLANKQEAIEKVVQTQKRSNTSLYDDQVYQKIRDLLPKGRLVTFYVSNLAMTSALTQFQTGLAANTDTLDSVQAVGVSLAAVGDGLRMDAIAVYDESKMNETQRQILASKAEFRSDGFFPEETLAFVHGQRPDLFWASYRESLINLTSQSDFEAAMATFEQTFGFNPDQELFPYLDGEWALAVLPDTDSVFNSSGQGSLGFSLLAGTSQEEKLSHTMDQFNLHAETLNAQVDTAELGDAQGYSITFAGLESPISYYGVHKGYLAITSSTNVFKDTFDGGQALRDQADYKGVWKSFPANTSPVFFANVSGLVEIVRDSMQGSVRDSFDETAQPYLKPLKAVALGVVPLQKGVVHTVLIVFINQ